MKCRRISKLGAGPLFVNVIYIYIYIGIYTPSIH